MSNEVKKADDSFYEWFPIKCGKKLSVEITLVLPFCVNLFWLKIFASLSRAMTRVFSPCDRPFSFLAQIIRRTKKEEKLLRSLTKPPAGQATTPNQRRSE